MDVTMILKKRTYFGLGFIAALVVLMLVLGLLYYTGDIGGCGVEVIEEAAAGQMDAENLVKEWAELSGHRKGKVVFARPPEMIILDLSTGVETVVPHVLTAGAPGRRRRGVSPRPSWAADGERFVYRYNGQVYVCDQTGNKTVIANPRMDCSPETRWSWFCQDNPGEGHTDWLVGPSKKKNVILVKVADPAVVITAYAGGDVEKHCEVTGSGKYVVYDNGWDIYVTAFGSGDRGVRISKGQSCRPCASPDDRAAWLMVPHVKYRIYNAADGRFMKDLNAPPGQELYRLNWSNDPDFAAHMFGSRGDTRMYVRKISTSGYLFIGHGWDPDLWTSD